MVESNNQANNQLRSCDMDWESVQDIDQLMSHQNPNDPYFNRQQFAQKQPENLEDFIQIKLCNILSTLLPENYSLSEIVDPINYLRDEVLQELKRKFPCDTPIDNAQELQNEYKQMANNLICHYLLYNQDNVFYHEFQETLRVNIDEVQTDVIEYFNNIFLTCIKYFNQHGDLEVQGDFVAIQENPDGMQIEQHKMEKQTSWTEQTLNVLGTVGSFVNPLNLVKSTSKPCKPQQKTTQKSDQQFEQELKQLEDKKCKIVLDNLKSRAQFNIFNNLLKKQRAPFQLQVQQVPDWLMVRAEQNCKDAVKSIVNQLRVQRYYTKYEEEKQKRKELEEQKSSKVSSETFQEAFNSININGGAAVVNNKQIQDNLDLLLKQYIDCNIPCQVSVLEQLQASVFHFLIKFYEDVGAIGDKDLYQLVENRIDDLKTQTIKYHKEGQQQDNSIKLLDYIGELQLCSFFCYIASVIYCQPMLENQSFRSNSQAPSTVRTFLSNYCKKVFGQVDYLIQYERLASKNHPKLQQEYDLRESFIRSRQNNDQQKKEALSLSFQLQDQCKKLKFEAIKLDNRFDSTDGPNITIAISGFLSQKDSEETWRGLPKNFCSPAYHFQWESGDNEQLLQVIGRAGGAKALMRVAGSAIFGGGGLGVFQILESGIYGVGSIRKMFNDAEKKAALSGQALACAIVLNIPPFAPGKTVNLVGFSLGCRVIDSCIKQLQIFNAKEIIQNVTLLGGAASATTENLKKLAQAFQSLSPHGVLKNIYTANDQILVLYMMSMMQPAIGRNELKLSPKEMELAHLRNFESDQGDESAIESVRNGVHIQNYDISLLGIDGWYDSCFGGIGHLTYRKNMEIITNFIELQ